MSEFITTPQFQIRKIHTLVPTQTITHLNEARESVAFAELAAGTGDYDLVRECIDNALRNLETAKDMAGVL